MRHRHLVTAGGLAAVIAFVSLAVIPVAGQATTASQTNTATYSPPKTPWGDPDLQGVYEYQTRLQLERPKQFVGRATLTPEEWNKLRVGNQAAGTATNRNVSTQDEEVSAGESAFANWRSEERRVGKGCVSRW